MKVIVTALMGMLGAVVVSHEPSTEPVWNSCEPLVVQPEDGKTVALPVAQYRVIEVEPLTVEYLGAPASANATDGVRGTAIVASLRCEP